MNENNKIGMKALTSGSKKKRDRWKEGGKKKRSIPCTQRRIQK